MNDTNIIHIDLDPNQNIKNKKYFKELLKNIVESPIEKLEINLNKFEFAIDQNI